MLANLTTAEKKRLTPITQQQSTNTSRLTAYGTLKDTLEKSQTANTALNSADLFKSTTATSSTEDLEVSTTTGAAPGKYTVSVTRLAQAQSLSTTARITSAKKQLGDTSIDEHTITTSQSGRKEPLEIKLGKGETSLEDIRDAISDASSGIPASLMKVKEGDYRLMLTTESGTESEMTISISNDSKLNNLLSHSSEAGSEKIKQLVGAQNAQLIVNGINIERQSNTVADTPQDTTLRLTKEVEDASIAVTKSGEKATTAIKAWVEAYNSLMDTFDTLTKYKEVKPGEAASADSGALLGDSVLRTVQSGIHAPFANSGSESSFKAMSEIGITQDGDTGKLKIDEEKLAKALENNTAATRGLLVGDGRETGITTKIAIEVKGYLTDDGVIDNAQDDVNANLKLLAKQYLIVSNSIGEVVARCKAQFAQLDSMMSKLSNTSTYLDRRFAAMSNS